MIVRISPIKYELSNFCVFGLVPFQYQYAQELLHTYKIILHSYLEILLDKYERHKTM